jgi:hypothetical protein
MKKSVYLLSIVFCLFFLNSQHSLYAQTSLSDTLFSDTTLTSSGNPYLVNRVLVIPDSVSLTVEEGVEIIFKAQTYVYLSGSLIINGTATDSVYMVGENAPLSGTTFNRVWEGIRFYGGAMEANYLVGAHSWSFLTDFNSTDIHIRNSSFLYNVGGADIRNGGFFDSCHIAFGAGGFVVRGGSSEIHNSLIEENYTGVDGTYATLINTVVQDNGIGVTVNGSRLEHCTIRNNLTGIQLIYNGLVQIDEDTSYLLNNEIIDSQVGFTIRDIDFDKAVITDNIICNDSMNLSFDNVPMVDVRHNCWCSRDSNEIVQKIEWVNVSAPFHPYIFLPYQKDCVPDDVYPGDANHDQIANMRDLLPIGQYFGMKGHVRPNASIAWTGQPSPDWGISQPNGFDIKHVDCNGDSTIDWADTLAIRQNYGFSHRSRRPGANNQGIPLILQAPATTLNPGDTARLPIILGTVDTMANNMYGIAFSIYYGTSQVVPTPSVGFINSWLGTPGSDLITFYYVDTIDQRIDIALVRNNQMARSGYGQIAELIVVIDDDMAKRQIPLAISLADPYGIDEMGAQQDIKLIDEPLSVQTSLVSGIESNFSIFPNPTKGYIWVSTEHTQAYGVKLYNLQGKELSARDMLFGDTRLDFSGYAEGMYILKIETWKGTLSRKIILR